MIQALSIIIMIFALIKWLTWRIQSLALISYIVRNGFREPTSGDIDKEIKFVVGNIVKRK